MIRVIGRVSGECGGCAVPFRILSDGEMRCFRRQQGFALAFNNKNNININNNNKYKNTKQIPP